MRPAGAVAVPPHGAGRGARRGAVLAAPQSCLYRRPGPQARRVERACPRTVHPMEYEVTKAFRFPFATLLYLGELRCERLRRKGGRCGWSRQIPATSPWKSRRKGELHTFGVVRHANRTL